MRLSSKKRSSEDTLWVCGKGLGHANHSRILFHYLQQRDLEVCFIAAGKAYIFLSKEFGKKSGREIGTNKTGYQENIQRKEVIRSIHLSNSKTYQNKFSLSDRYAFEVFVQNHLSLLYGSL